MGIITINGKKVEFTNEKNILTIIRKAGIEVPTLCYQPELSIFGACRLCTVEDDKGRLAVADGVEARHDFEQCGLAHAVGADHTDFRARQEAQRDVVENHAVSVSLTGVDHLIDKLSQSWFRSLLDCFLHGSGHTCIAHYSKRGLQRPPSHSKTYPGHKRSLTSSRISAPLWPDGVVYANVSAVTWICFRFGILTMIIGARKVWDWLVYFLLG